MDLSEIQKKIVIISDMYAKECSINRDDDWYVLKLQEEVGELIQRYLSFSGRGKQRGMTEKEIREGFAHELADVMGQVMLIANHHKIDVEKALSEKWFKYLK